MWGNYYYEITIMLLRATLKKKKQKQHSYLTDKVANILRLNEQQWRINTNCFYMQKIKFGNSDNYPY